MHDVLRRLVTNVLVTQAQLKAVCPQRSGGMSIDLREYSQQLGHKRLRSTRFQEIAQTFGRLGLTVAKLPGDYCSVEFGQAVVEQTGDFVFVTPPQQSSHAWSVASRV